MSYMGHFAYLCYLKKKKSKECRNLDWFSCHFLKFRILQPEHRTIDVVGSFSPRMVPKWAGSDFSAA